MLMLVFMLQLHEHKAILKVQITEWTPAGLVAKIEVNVIPVVAQVFQNACLWCSMNFSLWLFRAQTLCEKRLGMFKKI